MRASYVDAHCHLQLDAFDADREELIQEMSAKGVAAIVVGVDRATSEAAVALSEAHEHLFAAIGLHPHEERSEWFDVAAYEALAQSPKVVGIGECGLDYFGETEVTEEEKERQKVLFRDQVGLAAKLNMPLIIHARPKKGTVDAYQDVLAELTELKKVYGERVRGDVHFFVGGTEEAVAFSALGFTVSYTAVITFATQYDAVIRSAPLTQLLAETDAPYVAPASRRGKRNDPLAVIDVVARMAELRGEDHELVRSQILSNTLKMFALQGVVGA